MLLQQLSHKYKISMSRPSYENIKRLFFESTELFISNISVSLYYSTTTLILGVFTGLSYVGIYSSMEKIITALKSLYLPLYQALFPWFSKKTDIDISIIIKKMVLYVSFSALAISLLTIKYAEAILKLIFNQPNIIQHTIIFQIMTTKMWWYRMINLNK